MFLFSLNFVVFLDDNFLFKDINFIVIYEIFSVIIGIWNKVE